MLYLCLQFSGVNNLMSLNTQSRTVYHGSKLFWPMEMWKWSWLHIQAIICNLWCYHLACCSWNGELVIMLQLAAGNSS